MANQVFEAIMGLSLSELKRVYYLKIWDQVVYKAKGSVISHGHSFHQA